MLPLADLWRRRVFQLSECLSRTDAVSVVSGRWGTVVWAAAVVGGVVGPVPGTTTDAGEAGGGRPEPSADLLRQLDDDLLRAAEVSERISAFVALHLANELRAAGLQASDDDGADIVDCECDLADALGVRRRVPVAPRPDGV